MWAKRVVVGARVFSSVQAQCIVFVCMWAQVTLQGRRPMRTTCRRMCCPDRCTYNSIRLVGGQWFSYAWEPQLGETALHIALLSCPLLARRDGPRPLSLNMPVRHHVARCVLAWLAFRIMFAAGLLKVRSGDPCWVTYTCFDHHFENMPMPNPLTWYAHFLPAHIKAPPRNVGASSIHFLVGLQPISTFQAHASYCVCLGMC